MENYGLVPQSGFCHHPPQMIERMLERLVITNQSATEVVECRELHALVYQHGAYHNWMISCVNILKHEVLVGDWCDIKVTEIEGRIYYQH